MRHHRRGRADLGVRAEINVTSLVDVAFTLLVIFIITAPVMQGGIEVDVPRGPVRVIEASDDHIIVGVDAAGSFFIGSAQVAEEMLDARPHDFQQRCRPQTEKEHHRRKYGENRELPPADVGKRGDRVVRDRSVDHALVHPQRVRRPQDEGRRGENGNPCAGLEAREDDHELADESGGARQA